jgi:peptidoglycan endopeptidase LytE
MKKTQFACSTLLPLFLLLAFFASGSEASVEYKVKKGDSLYTIAKKHHVSVTELKNANAASANGIKPGDRVIIPSQKKEASGKTKSTERDKDSVSFKMTTKDNSAANIKETSKAVPKDLYHVVKKGDTLAAISRKYSVTISELKELNSLNKSAKLKNGQRLLVRSAGQKMYIAGKGDTIWNIAKKFNLSAEELMEINDMSSPSLKTGQKLYLEEAQPVLSELEDDAIITKTLEEELKNVSASENFSQINLRDKLTLFAKKLLNIPYKFGGNSILGIDCSAYVKKVYGFLGMELPRTAREQFNEGETIDKEDLSMGDLVFFRTYASFPSHVGIYLGNNLFIHASPKGKKVKVDNLDTPYFVKRFIGAKRLLNDENKSADPQD